MAADHSWTTRRPGRRPQPAFWNRGWRGCNRRGQWGFGSPAVFESRLGSHTACIDFARLVAL